MEDIVQDVEIVEEFEILEHKSNISDPEISSFSITQFTDFFIPHIHGSLQWSQNASYEVEKGGLTRPARSDYRYFFRLFDYKLRDAETEIAFTVLEIKIADRNHNAKRLE
jgi:hypothetical protein